MHDCALVTNIFAHLPEDRRELLHVILDEIYLRVVVLLNPVESIAVFVLDLVDMFIDLIDTCLVLLFCLATSELSMANLLLKARVN